MAAPAPSWNTCRVVGTWHNLDGSRRTGTYKVTIPVRVTNTTDDVIIPAGVAMQGTLEVDSGAPSLDIQVPSNTDPDNSPAGWQVVIDVTFPDAAGEKYVIDTPVDGVVNLRTVVLAASIPAPQPVLIRGVPGGLAELDETGKVPVDQIPDGIGGGMDPDAVDEHLATTEALADVARTGSYGDLSDTPTIPTVPATLPPTNGSVTPAKVATGYALLTSAQQTKVDGLPSDAQSASQVDTRADARIAAVRGVANGVAALDSAGKLPTSALPPLAIGETFTVTSQAAMLALTAQRGDLAIRTDLDPDGVFILTADTPGTLSAWVQITAPGAVLSVNGQSGAVVLSTVASTGSYSDLSNKPTIPTVPSTLPPTDGSVTAAKMASGLVAMTDAERTKLTALPAEFTTATDARINSLVPSASATVQGKVELATVAEATAGTDTARAVTPAGVKAVADTKVGSPNATVSGIEWYASEASLPTTGVAGVIYCVDATA